MIFVFVVSGGLECFFGYVSGVVVSFGLLSFPAVLFSVWGWVCLSYVFNYVLFVDVGCWFTFGWCFV